MSTPFSTSVTGLSANAFKIEGVVPCQRLAVPRGLRRIVDDIRISGKIRDPSLAFKFAGLRNSRGGPDRPSACAEASRCRPTTAPVIAPPPAAQTAWALKSFAHRSLHQRRHLLRERGQPGGHFAFGRKLIDIGPRDAREIPQRSSRPAPGLPARIQHRHAVGIAQRGSFIVHRYKWCPRCPETPRPRRAPPGTN